MARGMHGDGRAIEALEGRTLMDSSLAAVPREILSTTADIQSVVTADFNGDGRVDIAVSAGRQVLVLLRNPQSGYARPLITRLAQAAGSLALANMDGDGVPDLTAFGGRAGAGQQVVLRALIGRGDGRFAVADRAFVPIAASDGAFMAVGDVYPGHTLTTFPPLDAREEVVVGTSTAGVGEGQTGLRVYRFDDGRFDDGSVVADSGIGGSFVKPVFFDVDGDRDLDIIMARNGPASGTVVAILSGVPIDDAPVELLLAQRDGRIDSVMAGDLGEDHGGVRIVFARTEPDDAGGFFTWPGDSVVETMGLAGEDATEIHREANENFIYGEPVDRVILLLGLADSNSDGRADIIAEERLNGPRPSPRAVMLPLAVHRESVLLQLVGPSDALGAFRAVRSHHVGGTSTSSAAPLSAAYDPRYALGNIAGVGAADLLMFRDKSLLLGLGNGDEEAPVISRIEPAEILPAVVGAYAFTAEGVYDTDAARTGYVASIRVYLDRNGNGRWDTRDPLIHIDQDGSDGWHFGGIAPTSWPRHGRVFIVAQDDTGLLSDVVEWAINVPQNPLVG